MKIRGEYRKYIRRDYFKIKLNRDCFGGLYYQKRFNKMTMYYPTMRTLREYGERMRYKRLGLYAHYGIKEK